MKTGPMITGRALVIADNLYNIGDLALLRQVVYGMQASTAITDITIRQRAVPPKGAAQYFAERGCKLGRSKWQFLFSPGRIIVVGGGQFIRDNLSISYLLFTIFTLTTTGRPAIALAIGGGAINSGFRRWLWRILLARFAVITLRDQTSLELTKDILPSQASVDVTCDLAFLPSSLHDELTPNNEVHAVLVAPCFSHEESRLIDSAWVARMCAGLAAHFRINLVSIVPHDERPNVDPLICSAIDAELRVLGGLAIDRMADCTLESALGSYRACAVVLTNRLHSLIFALLAGKPALVIDDGNPKLRAYAERFLVELLPQGCGIDALTEALNRQSQPQVLAARAAALDIARTDAARNFQLLCDSLA